MSTFNPEKLSVTYMSGTMPTDPIIPRLYTLRHSDETGELFLDIGRVYAWWKVNPLRDEVLGEWVSHGASLFYKIYLYLDQGEIPLSSAEKRNEVFRRELPLAIKAIKYGDKLLFEAYPFLNQVPIVVNFISNYPELARQEMWGTFQLPIENPHNNFKK